MFKIYVDTDSKAAKCRCENGREVITAIVDGDSITRPSRSQICIGDFPKEDTTVRVGVES